MEEKLVNVVVVVDENNRNEEEEEEEEKVKQYKWGGGGGKTMEFYGLKTLYKCATFYVFLGLHFAPEELTWVGSVPRLRKIVY